MFVPGRNASLLWSAGDGVIQEEAEEAPDEHAGLQQDDDDLVQLLHGGEYEAASLPLLLHPLRQDLIWESELCFLNILIRSYQREENRETQHEEVSCGVEIHELKVGQSDGGDHPEHHAENASHYRTGNGEEQGS